jgi:uncharacterized protein
MRRSLTALLLCLLPWMALAEAEIPALAHRVTDLTGTLTAPQQSALESRLAAFEQQKGSQVALLIVPTTQPEAIEQYSIRVVEQWKLGRKGVDDGVLLLVAKDDRKLRIEVGYGLEGVLPDAIAKRIIAETITPHFKQGDFYGGVAAGLESILGVIQGEPLPAPKSSPSSGASPGNFLAHYFMMIFVVAMIAGSILRAVLGSFVGGLTTGGLVGFIVWALGAGLIFALVLAVIAFVLTLLGVQGSSGGTGSGGFSSGSGGFSSGGGGFSGGGGSFGGGGASGSW